MRVATRVGLIIVAALAVTWFAYDLRALSLASQARKDARVARSPEQLNHALSLFSDAARVNADPTPRIDQARLLLSLGRTRQAAGVLNDVVRANPGNVEAWSLLAAATGGRDPVRADEAYRQLRILFGQPIAYAREKGYLISPAGGVIVLSADEAIGYVEGVRVIGKTAEVSGWSATRPAGARYTIPSDQILVVSGGRYVGAGAPTIATPRVAKFIGAVTTRIGFRIDVPLASLERGGRPVPFQVYASLNDVASRLRVICVAAIQIVGCTR